MGVNTNAPALQVLPPAGTVEEGSSSATSKPTDEAASDPESPEDFAAYQVVPHEDSVPHADSDPEFAAHSQVMPVIPLDVDDSQHSVTEEAARGLDAEGHHIAMAEHFLEPSVPWFQILHLHLHTCVSPCAHTF